MAVTVRQFKTKFPEFRQVDDVLVQRVLDEAANRTNRPLFGINADAALQYMAADLLTLSPEGQKARVLNTDKLSPYREEWRRLARAYSIGNRVT